MSELLQQCHEVGTDLSRYVGWMASEKLDGHRAFWDGGLTIGMPKSLVPWANTVKDTDSDLRSPSTGLWSRYGNIIHAPSWFTAGLPRGVLLDGELWAGYSHRQDLPIKGYNPTFSGVKYHVYDMIPASTMAAVRTYRCTGYKVTTRVWDMVAHSTSELLGATGYFDRYAMLRELTLGDHAQALVHTRITNRDHLHTMLATVLAAGGEGLVLKGNTPYVCARSKTALKLKPTADMEGVLVGFVAGELTDRGSRLRGMIGSLVVKLPSGQTLNLSGLTDAERQLMPELQDVSYQCPGSSQLLNAGLRLNSLFTCGDRITFTYRGLTRDGLPMEARYLRKRIDL